MVPDALVVGAFVGAHGIRGEVKLRPLTEYPERIAALRELLVRRADGSTERLRVVAIRQNNQLYLLRLEGLETREAAEALRGASVLVPLEEAAPLPEGRYYHHQLLGLRVVTPEGEELGRVNQIMECASNDVYVAGAWMIPATRDAVLRIAPEEGVIVVRSKEYLEGEEIR